MQVGSRRVIQTCGVILVLFGLLSKVGALFITIPTPIIGGIFSCERSYATLWIIIGRLLLFESSQESLNRPEKHGKIGI